MPRKNTPPVTGEIYHIYNRGVDKRKVFSNRSDYFRFYKSLLLFNSAEPITDFRHADTEFTKPKEPLVEVHAYALLPNHYHLILKQLSEGGISEFMKRVGGGYTSYFNLKYQRSGVLFQGGYKKVHIDSDEQYRYLFAYVNENHLVHRIDFKRDFFHSSSLHFQGAKRNPVIGINNVTYDFQSAQKLAQSIYSKRQELGINLLE